MVGMPDATATFGRVYSDLPTAALVAVPALLEGLLDEAWALAEERGFLFELDAAGNDGRGGRAADALETGPHGAVVVYVRDLMDRMDAVMGELAARGVIPAFPDLSAPPPPARRVPRLFSC